MGQVASLSNPCWTAYLCPTTCSIHYLDYLSRNSITYVFQNDRFLTDALQTTWGDMYIVSLVVTILVVQSSLTRVFYGGAVIYRYIITIP